MNKGRLAAAVLATVLVAAAGHAQAAPADDYQRGLQAYHAGDVVGAMSALRAPAQAGHGPSQALLGFILDRADFTTEAARWYRSAADQGEPEGHAGMAHLYATGRGVAKDEKAALQHFSKAADLGHVASMHALANAYLKRQAGLDPSGRDAEAARAAWRRAAAHGHAESAAALRQLGEVPVSKASTP